MMNLLQRLQEEEVDVRFGKQLTAIAEEPTDSVKVTFADGTTDTCDLLDTFYREKLEVGPPLLPQYTRTTSLISFAPAKDLSAPLYLKGNFGAWYGWNRICR